MNDRLQKAIEKIYSKYTPTYFHDGDFTLCILWDKDVESIKAIGITKRNPAMDEYNEEFGNSVALARAVKKIMKPVKKKAKK